MNFRIIVSKVRDNFAFVVCIFEIKDSDTFLNIEFQIGSVYPPFHFGGHGNVLDEPNQSNGVLPYLPVLNGNKGRSLGSLAVSVNRGIACRQNEKTKRISES
jgi:hypothetical protein